MDNTEVKSCYRKAILHNYIPWNGYPDITKRVKVVAEVNYYNGDKGYLYVNYDHNAKVQRVSESYIEFEPEKTNAEVYIGDEDTIDEFIGKFTNFLQDYFYEAEPTYLKEILTRFFKEKYDGQTY